MYTKYDFPDIFRKKLYQKAHFIVEKYSTELEKDMLEEHSLLTKLCNIPWSPRQKKGELGLFVGGSEGLDNVHEAYFIAHNIKNNFPNIKIRFITAGAIGVAINKAKEMGVPGVNAKVM